MLNDLSKIKIAISGKSGCGNTTVSKLLSEKLGLEQINYTFRNMSKEKGIEFYEFCKMAENDTKYDIELDNKQIELASKGGCVLGSRLAIWLLKDADLKIYLSATDKTRAERVFLREGGDFDETYKKTVNRDECDRKRYQKLYNIDNNDYSCADLIIDAGSYFPNEIVDQIISFLEKKGYKINL